MFFEFDRPLVDEPHVDALGPYEVTAGEVPGDVAGVLQPLIAAAADQGFFEPVFHAFEDGSGGVAIYSVGLVHESQSALARVFYRQDGDSAPTSFATVLTAFEDGTYILSSASDSDMLPPAQCMVNQVTHTTFGELWASHWSRIAQRNDAVRIENEDDLRDELEQYHALIRDHYLDGGVFRESEELDAETADEELFSESDRNASVLEELERLRTKTSGWQSSALVLGLSVFLFFALGAVAWSWEFVLLLIPVLLFHELGHYVAMRVFGYRDLRMFFIPLAGAAVSGKHYNIAGWKRVVVSLMGPLPGIVLGIALGIVALVADIPWLLPVATLLLFLNTFNLLPFLPLDGGWVVHTILFSRHTWLDAAFRSGAALALIGCGWLIGGRLLAIVGVVMLIGMPLAIRLSKITAKARGLGLRLAATGNDEIPLQTANAIIDEVREGIPQGQLNDRTTAQFTLQVFERLNARPPGWIASLMFLSLHGGSLLVGTVFFVLFAAGGPQNLMGFMNLAVDVPQTSYECGSVLEHPDNDAGVDLSVVTDTIVATYDDRAAAEAAFRPLSDALPARWRLHLFGNAVLVSFPRGDEARPEYEQLLATRAKHVVVSDEAGPVEVTVACLAPDAQSAEQIADKLQAYLQCGERMYLVPPWSPVYQITEQQNKARRTNTRLSRIDYQDQELKRINQELIRADDAEEYNELSEAYSKREAELVQMHRDQLKAEGPEHVDVALIDLQSRQPAVETPADLENLDDFPDVFNQETGAWQREMGALMGQLPLDGDAPLPGELRYSVQYGFVQQGGLLLTFAGSFEQIAAGLPAFANWLCNQGCIDVTYGFDFELFGQFAP